MKKINFLKNKKVTVLCSGPSAENHKDDNDIVIVPNRSILLPQIVKYKKIIWLNGTGWQRNNVYSWWKEMAENVKCSPNVILARKANDKWHPLFNRFEKEFSTFFPTAEVTHMIDGSEFGVLSTGIKCIQLALQSEVASIEIAGMEMGIDTKYCDNLTNLEVVVKMGTDSFKRHLKADERYLNSLTASEIELLNPNKNSGLYQYLNKRRKQ